jgi:hypothetical protein
MEKCWGTHISASNGRSQAQFNFHHYPDHQYTFLRSILFFRSDRSDRSDIGSME